MELHRKIARVIADEGFHGLLQRVKRTKNAGDSPLEKQKKEQYVQMYQQSVKNFQDKARTQGHSDISRYYWYHAVDLGNGLITPGEYDYRDCLSSFGFPSSMANMNVLDVGSATGFFAFEFEKRGANVISVELPSIADWDMPTGEEKNRTLQSLMEYHQVDSVDAVYHYHLDGPFKFCHKKLGSRVKRVYSTTYELSASKLGLDQFDIIFLGHVLLHTFGPLKALSVLAPLCKGTLIITEHLVDEKDDAKPLMLYVGGATPTGDRRTWWFPNKVCMEQMLQRLGFRTVRVVSHLDVIERPTGQTLSTAIFHATK